MPHPRGAPGQALGSKEAEGEGATVDRSPNMVSMGREDRLPGIVSVGSAAHGILFVWYLALGAHGSGQWPPM